jgi:integrase
LSIKFNDRRTYKSDGSSTLFCSVLFCSVLFLLAAASGLRIGELLALQKDDIDFDNSTIRVDESVDRLGQIGQCKNVAAYRTVVLADTEGQCAMQS